MIATMESTYVTLLSLIVFLPAVGALVLAFFPREQTDGDEDLLAGRHGRRVRC